MAKLSIQPFFGGGGLAVPNFGRASPQDTGAGLLAGALGVAAQVTDRMADEQAEREASNALLKARTDFEAFKDGLRGRQDYGAFAGEWESFAKTWQAQNLQGLSSRGRQRVEGQIAGLAGQYGGQVRDIGWATQVDVSRAELLTATEQTLELVRRDPVGPVARETLAELTARIDGMAERGLLSAEQTASMKLKVKEGYRDATLTHALYADPEGFKRAVTGGGAGGGDHYGAIEGLETGGLGTAAAGAVSTAGAVGVMQVLPGTARETAAKLGLTDVAKMDDAAITEWLKVPANSRQVGRAYYDEMLRRYGDPVLAAAAYNAGPGSVDAWLKTNGDPRQGAISVADWAKLIPYQETREYILGNDKRPGFIERTQGGGGAGPNPYGLAPDEADAWAGKADRLIREQQAQAQIDLEPTLKDHLAMYEVGQAPDKPMTLDQFAAMYGAEAGQEAFRQYEGARRLGGELAAVGGLSASELDAWVAALQPDPKAPNFAEQQTAFKIAQQARERALKLRGEDPMRAAMMANATVERAFQSYAESGDTDLLASAVRAGLKEQERLGIPADKRVGLTAEAAVSVADGFAKAETAEEKLGVLASITTELQDDEAARVVLAQLQQAGVPGGMEWALDAWGRGDRGAAIRIATALTGPEVKLEGEGKKDLKAAIADTYDQGAGRVLALQASWMGQPEAWQRAADQQGLVGRVAALHVAAGMDAGKAAQQAVADVTGGGAYLLDEDLAAVTLPATFDGEAVDQRAVANGLTVLREQVGTMLTLDDLRLLVGDESAVADMEYQLLLDDLADDGRWVNHGEGFALAMPSANGGMALVTRADGSVVSVTLRRVLDAAAKDPRAAFRPIDLTP